MNGKWLVWMPLIAIGALFAMFFVSLRQPADRTIASQIVGQPLPDFITLPALATLPATRTGDFGQGRPRLLNIFGSWCVPCKAEMPMLVRLQAAGVPIEGIAVHDNRDDLGAFLATYGNPYASIGLDEGGKAQIAFGSSGVPETFVVDRSGRIIDQYIGAISEDQAAHIIRLMGTAP